MQSSQLSISTNLDIIYEKEAEILSNATLSPRFATYIGQDPENAQKLLNKAPLYTAVRYLGRTVRLTFTSEFSSEDRRNQISQTLGLSGSYGPYEGSASTDYNKLETIRKAASNTTVSISGLGIGSDTDVLENIRKSFNSTNSIPASIAVAQELIKGADQHSTILALELKELQDLPEFFLADEAGLRIEDFLAEGRVLRRLYRDLIETRVLQLVLDELHVDETVTIEQRDAVMLMAQKAKAQAQSIISIARNILEPDGTPTALPFSRMTWPFTKEEISILQPLYDRPIANNEFLPYVNELPPIGRPKHFLVRLRGISALRPLIDLSMTVKLQDLELSSNPLLEITSPTLTTD